MNGIQSDSSVQSGHYDGILDAYERHYFDHISMAYRDEFIYTPLFQGLDLNGLRVLDLAAGSGYNSLAILKRFPEAQLTGLDISPRACERYRAVVGRPAHQVDLTRPVDIGGTFDVAMIIGGLHHCVADLDGALQTISGLLRPGGLLLMYEPNGRYILEPIRRIWYRFDNYFDHRTERALNHAAMARQAAPDFLPETVTHFGGPAAMLIYNSLVFRISPKVKARLAPVLFALERVHNYLPGTLFHANFVARWRKIQDISSS